VKKHRLKIKDYYLEDVLSGNKPFEVRYNDRGYQKGDMIIFRLDTDSSIAERARATISYVLSEYGLKESFVVLGLKDIKELP
jgi:ASC-1-like (ASCH) protein